jgi:hypothetical protein
MMVERLTALTGFCLTLKNFFAFINIKVVLSTMLYNLNEQCMVKLFFQDTNFVYGKKIDKHAYLRN